MARLCSILVVMTRRSRRRRGRWDFGAGIASGVRAIVVCVGPTSTGTSTARMQRDGCQTLQSIRRGAVDTRGVLLARLDLRTQKLLKTFKASQLVLEASVNGTLSSVRLEVQGEAYVRTHGVSLHRSLFRSIHSSHFKAQE